MFIDLTQTEIKLIQILTGNIVGEAGEARIHLDQLYDKMYSITQEFMTDEFKHLFGQYIILKNKDLPDSIKETRPFKKGDIVENNNVQIIVTDEQNEDGYFCGTILKEFPNNKNNIVGEHVLNIPSEHYKLKKETL